MCARHAPRPPTVRDERALPVDRLGRGGERLCMRRRRVLLPGNLQPCDLELRRRQRKTCSSPRRAVTETRRRVDHRRPRDAPMAWLLEPHAAATVGRVGVNGTTRLHHAHGARLHLRLSRSARSHVSPSRKPPKVLPSATSARSRRLRPSTRATLPLHVAGTHQPRPPPRPHAGGRRLALLSSFEPGVRARGAGARKC